MGNEVQTLKELISINSENTKTNKKIIEHIAKKLNRFEQKLYKYKKAELELYNLVVKVKGKSSKNPLLFVGHTDTVPTTEKWTMDPFKATIKGNKLYGLGACDMKAGLAAMIEAALQLNKKPANDVYLIFDADEEAGSSGAKELIKTFKVKNAFSVIPECSGAKITLGQKGVIEFHIETSGKAMQSSLSTLKNNVRNNAIYKAVKIMNALIDYECRIERKKMDKFGSATQNIGFVQGGSAPNVVADKCIIKVCRRILPNENLNEEIDVIKKIIKKADSGVKVTISATGNPFQTSKNLSFIKKIARISRKELRKIRYNVLFGWTEAALFTKYGSCVIFGPGDMEPAHKANEYTSIENLKKFVRIYKDLMLSN